ncbi:Nickel transport system permease protein NikB [Streptomyces sp. RB5]|uniref:Nickel transport system permease protein NikB n=1 Tax=Streptomyces smaragdinus TaxID=2585196 RepID=A0A7K0CQS8_9ACTN|nr:ABC transporter permease [Streptomyces smaragdinus]MQY15830.1 Nickel transport system permease protein NikB [Streptomyces smaragdinus]
MSTTAPDVASVRTGERTTGIARRILRNYVVRRVFRSLFVIWVVTTVMFFMLRLLPGNPVDTYIATQMRAGGSYESAAATAAGLFTFDPSTPLIQQYGDYLWALLHGDLGNSLTGTTVVEKISSGLPWTLFSVGYALLIAIGVGLLLGVLMAYRRGGVLDHTVSVIGSVLHAIPNYLFAIILVVFGGVQLGLFDVADIRGTYTAGVEPELSFTFVSDAFYHASLPVTVYVLTTFGTWALVMKASTITTLEEDYVTVARARGLSDRRIGTQYVGRNAVLPMIAQIATQGSFVFGTAIFVELILKYDGISAELFAAINDRDYATVQGILLLMTFVVVFSNLLAELVNSALDPRIRESANGAGG